MKIVFAGPSLCGSRSSLRKRFPHLIFAPPAARGDILLAVNRGAKAIGLIDGYFGDRSSVWHKEILFAMSRGVIVGGGASMGALRAAECEAFGMVGIGTIFSCYAEGRLEDDEAVALIHGPEELDWLPLSVPRVEYQATFEHLSSLGFLSAIEREKLLLTASFIHYSKRTYQSIVEACTFLEEQRKQWLLGMIENYKIDLKRDDATRVVEWLDATEVGSPHVSWTFSATSHWERLRLETRMNEGIGHDL